MSIALGPLGRNGEALGSLNTSGKVAAMFVVLLEFLIMTHPDYITGIPIVKPEAYSAACQSKALSSSRDKTPTPSRIRAISR